MLLGLDDLLHRISVHHLLLGLKAWIMLKNLGNLLLGLKNDLLFFNWQRFHLFLINWFLLLLRFHAALSRNILRLYHLLLWLRKSRIHLVHHVLRLLLSDYLLLLWLKLHLLLRLSLLSDVVSQVIGVHFLSWELIIGVNRSIFLFFFSYWAELKLLFTLACVLFKHSLGNVGLTACFFHQEYF